MNLSTTLLKARKALFVLAASLLFSACGGGGSSGAAGDNQAPTTQPPTPTTGTIGILFTDKATDAFESITLQVTEAVLIGDEGQHVVFDGLEEVDLLNLENFVEPIIFGEVPIGTYSKLRLRISEMLLMPAGGSPMAMKTIESHPNTRASKIICFSSLSVEQQRELVPPRPGLYYLVKTFDLPTLRAGITQRTGQGHSCPYEQEQCSHPATNKRGSRTRG